MGSTSFWSSIMLLFFFLTFSRNLYFQITVGLLGSIYQTNVHIIINIHQIFLWQQNYTTRCSMANEVLLEERVSQQFGCWEYQKYVLVKNISLPENISGPTPFSLSSLLLCSPWLAVWHQPLKINPRFHWTFFNQILFWWFWCFTTFKVMSMLSFSLQLIE